MQAAEHFLDRIPTPDQVPWWWPIEVARARRTTASGIPMTGWSRSDAMPMYRRPPSAKDILTKETVAGVCGRVHARARMHDAEPCTALTHQKRMAWSPSSSSSVLYEPPG